MSSSTAWKEPFLHALAQTGLVSPAAKAAGVSRQAAYRARSTRNRTGPALLEAQSFAQQWDAALELAADSAEVEVRRRAMEGTERIHDVYRQGQKISTTVTRHYSDRLLMFLLEKLRPDTYGDPAPHICNHCGCNPQSQPSPEEAAGRKLLDTYLDRLIAQSRAKPPVQQAEPSPAAAFSPASQPPTSPTPSSQPPVPFSQPLSPFSKSDSVNQPASVSTNLSTSPAPIFSGTDSTNQPHFVSTPVSTFHILAPESAPIQDITIGLPGRAGYVRSHLPRSGASPLALPAIRPQATPSAIPSSTTLSLYPNPPPSTPSSFLKFPAPLPITGNIEEP